MKPLFVLLLLQSVLLAQAKHRNPCSAPLGSVNSFAVVYFPDDSLNELAIFDMVIVDPADYDSSDIAKLKSLGCQPFAYLNVGEVETYRDYFDMIDTSILLGPDPKWKERYYVDLCDPQWYEVISKFRLPDIMDKGFCGLLVDFSDLLDEFPETEDCAVKLIKKIHKGLPNTAILVDGAARILDKIGNDVDGVAVEGLIGTYDFDADEYGVQPDSTVDRESARLLAFAKKFKTSIFQIDYAPSADRQLRENIIEQSRKFGFIPYVGTVELDTLFTDSVRKSKLIAPKNAKSTPDTLK
ncbi:MAG TPA: endo alpha-1,4 polygalactosaminidase [Candidatus Kryptonia bacterium]